jgi:NADH-quinone oxidoreductase subunit L
MKPIVVSTLALLAVIIGVGLAIGMYRKEVPVVAPEKVSVFTRIARRDLMQDAFNEAVLMRPGQKLTEGLVKTDYFAIDGLVRLVAGIFAGTSTALRKIQNGYVRSYALIMVGGALALIATIWVVTL